MWLYSECCDYMYVFCCLAGQISEKKPALSGLLNFDAGCGTRAMQVTLVDHDVINPRSV